MINILVGFTTIQIHIGMSGWGHNSIVRYEEVLKGCFGFNIDNSFHENLKNVKQKAQFLNICIEKKKSSFTILHSPVKT